VSNFLLDALHVAFYLYVENVADMLHTEELPENQTVLPSPEDLRGYILVKVILHSVILNLPLV